MLLKMDSPPKKAPPFKCYTEVEELLASTMPKHPHGPKKTEMPLEVTFIGIISLYAEAWR